MTRIKNDTPTTYYFYKLVCNDPSITEFYIGSTVNWRDRKSDHKSSVCNKNHKNYTSKKAQTIRANGGWDNWSMIEIERGIYIKRTAEAHEYDLMAQMKSTMNKNKCFGATSKCEHGIIKRYCKECKGSKICEHNKQKTHCITCKGGSTCEHGYTNKRICPYCSPYLCECGVWTTEGKMNRHFQSSNCKAFHMTTYGRVFI